MATLPLTMPAIDHLPMRQATMGLERPETALLFALRRLFYPAVVLLVIGAHLFFASGLPASQHSLVTGAISLVCLGIFLVMERVLPYRAGWNRDRGDLVTDAVQTNLFLPLIARLNETALAVAITWLAAQGLWSGIFPVHAPLALQVVLALVSAEFCYYWVHRLGHTTFLWQFHAVHHGSERVYSLNAGRFHLVDAWLGTLAYLGPMLLLGVPAPVIALIATLNAVTGFMEHANIDFEAAWLNRVFNTAQLHRWHHAADLAIANCNYGKVISIWDQVFDTYYLPEGGQVGAVGVGPTETPVPNTLMGQTLYPWRR